MHSMKVAVGAGGSPANEVGNGEHQAGNSARSKSTEGAVEDETQARVYID